MQQMNKPPQYIPTCLKIEASEPLVSTQYNPPIAAISARVNGKRTYQRGLSKQMMNDRRYSANGNTQRKGMTATSWQILFVVASSKADAHAGSRSQRSRERGVGCISSLKCRAETNASALLSGTLCAEPPSTAAGFDRNNLIAHTPAQIAYTTNPQPQNIA